VGDTDTDTDTDQAAVHPAGKIMHAFCAALEIDIEVSTAHTAYMILMAARRPRAAQI
jgi:hypothetical protein